MHLAAFLPNLEGGGAEQVAVTLCNSFARRGARVDLVLARSEGAWLDLLERNVRTIDLKCNWAGAWIGRLAGYLNEHQPDALMSALPHANVAAILACRLAGGETRSIISEHTTMSMIGSTSHRPLARLLPHVARVVYPRAAQIVCVSEGVADDLIRTTRIPRNRVQVIYNPVDLERVASQRTERAPHDWLLNRESQVVVTAGRLIPAKNHLGLLDAFALLRRTRRCRLIILGEGKLRRQLEARVRELGLADDVLMPGFVMNPFAWIARADLLVLSSVREGLPTSLIEAMACGTPVVSTDCPSGPSEILENGKWGRLVPVGNAAALADAIAATLDEERHPDVARRAADFSVERAVEGYARVLGLDL